ncbi:hypothetical protein ACFQH6_20745 [Halobacteriaceae archaeon GCM10025711]
MADVGYCTVEDLRRALRKAGLPGDAAQDRDIALDAITSQTEWLQEQTHRHWYEPNGIAEDTDDIIPTSPLTHNEDEQDIPTRAFLTTTETDRSSYYPPTWVDYDPDDEDEPEYEEMDGLTPQQHRGPFTRVTLFRRDVSSISELLVLSTTGYEDWVANADYTEGRTGDYYLHVDDSTGLTRLYLNTDSLDPDLESYAGAVVATYDYGIEGLSDTVRRAVALKAGSDLAEEAAVRIPENATLYNVETKAEEMERKAMDLLEIHLANGGR